MPDQKNPETIEEFIGQLHTETGWDGLILKNVEQKGNTVLVTKLTIKGQDYEVQIRGLESRQVIALNVYFPITVIEGKFVDATMLCNRINQDRNYSGKITLDDKGLITSKALLFVEDLMQLKKMVYLMLDSCCALFERYSEALTAVAQTTKTYETIRDQECQHKAIENKPRFTPPFTSQ
jgi:hypothetical protein